MFNTQLLVTLAHRYNTPEFILTDPVQFPHRYTDKRDIEISAFVTAWISWGNRKQIIKTNLEIATVQVSHELRMAQLPRRHTLLIPHRALF